jgi:hypothetical protein
MSDEMQQLIHAVSEHTGIPVSMLSGDTAAAVWDSAIRAEQWRVSTAPAAPRPPTAAVSPASPQTPIPTPQQIVNGSGDYLSAWRSGRLAPAGIPAPPPRAPRDQRGMPW